METLTRLQLNRATLARQLLLERAAVGVVEAVDRLAGLQAQEPRPPFVGLWSRVDGFESSALIEAVHEGSILRATLMRATLHLVPAATYPVLRSALEPVLTGALRVLGPRAEAIDLPALLAEARRVLADGPLTFAELRPRLQAAFPSVDERALGYAVRLTLPLRMVPSDDPWGFPRSAAFDVVEAPVVPDATPSLVRRYLRAFGPASAADAQTWSGLRGLAPVLDAMRDELVTFRDERRRQLFDLPDAPRPDGAVPAPPRFLPDFDNLVLAHADRHRVLGDLPAGTLTTKNLRVRASFLVDGFVAGTWSVERTGKAAALVLAPFSPLTGDVDALVEEGAALLRFVEPRATAHEVRMG